MFFVVDLWKNVCVKPSQLGARYEQHVSDLLRNEVEGKCLGQYGYVVCVVRILIREKGRVQDGSGFVITPVKYQAVVFQPMKEEVMDGIITSVNALGFFAQCGPVKAFVSRMNFSADYEMVEGVWTDGETKLAVDKEVRLRILGFKYETNGMTAVGQIDQDYLGPMV